jgi:GT2 family glycosyltransferase
MDQPMQLTVSIVIYTLDQPVLLNTLQSLALAIESARQSGELESADVFLVDNGNQHEALRALADKVLTAIPIEILSGHGNIGYGKGHNLVINRPAPAEASPDSQPSNNEGAFLILNPDVVLQAATLINGLQFLKTNPQTVAVAPAIRSEQGEPEYGCKRYPSILDFLLRGFAPQSLRKKFSSRLAYYEMHDLPGDQASKGIPIISGCFMLFRCQQLRQLRGFDPRYFLYFEDFDLSMRAQKMGTLAFLPAMQIVHLGGRSARKGWRHIGMFARSAVQFFSTHGWRWS